MHVRNLLFFLLLLLLLWRLMNNNFLLLLLPLRVRVVFIVSRLNYGAYLFICFYFPLLSRTRKSRVAVVGECVPIVNAILGRLRPMQATWSRKNAVFFSRFYRAYQLCTKESSMETFSPSIQGRSVWNPNGAPRNKM